MNASLIIFKIPCFSVSVWITDLIGKGIWQRSEEKGWCCDENLITELELSGERGLQNKCELVFNILVINVKASAHHICAWCDCRWQISQTCYLSSLQLARFFCVLGFLFCWEVTEGLIKKAGNSSILKKAPVQPWQSAHGFRPTRTWPAVSPPTRARTHRHPRTPELPPLTINTNRLSATTSHLVCRLSRC